MHWGLDGMAFGNSSIGLEVLGGPEGQGRTKPRFLLQQLPSHERDFSRPQRGGSFFAFALCGCDPALKRGGRYRAFLRDELALEPHRDIRLLPEEVFYRLLEHSWLINKGHVAGSGQDDQLGTRDLFVHHFRHCGIAFIVISHQKQSGYFDCR
jgi:hypothetical protein